MKRTQVSRIAARPPHHSVLAHVERITAVGVALSAAELLTRHRLFREDGILSWDAARTRHRWMSGRLERLWSPVYSHGGVRVLLVSRAAAAAALVAPTSSPVLRRVAAQYAALSGYVLALRTPYGSDGAESLSTLTMAAAALGRSVPGGAGPALGFLAAQSVLSYAVAGLAKILSPMWMDGTAIRDVFRTRMFGERRAFALVRGRPRLCLVMGRAVAVVEVLAPLVLLLPRHRRGLPLAMLGLFHLGTAAVMGLNRFPWAFIGTYPAVMAVGGLGTHLGRRSRA